MCCAAGAIYIKPLLLLYGVVVEVDEPQVVVPVDVREITTLYTDQGEIHIIHELTLGDLVLSTLLMAILLFLIISRVVRR